MKFPVDLEKIIEISDPIYTFNEIMNEVELNHVYIDGTKLEANANKYSRVWKKSCITNRNKMFVRITKLIEEINTTDLLYLNVEIGTRQEYSVEYVEYISDEYKKLMQIDTSAFVYGSGKRIGLSRGGLADREICSDNELLEVSRGHSTERKFFGKD